MSSIVEPYPQPVAELTRALALLPGLNRRSAEKIALAYASGGVPEDLPQLIASWRDVATRCSGCNRRTDRKTCTRCVAEPMPLRICVVETDVDAWAIARSGPAWTGAYHVLDGLIDPSQGVSPEDLDTRRLLRRVASIAGNPMGEVLIATPNTTQGNLTAQWLAEHIARLNITATALSRGIAHGAQVRSQAPATLKAAFANRQPASRSKT